MLPDPGQPRNVRPIPHHATAPLATPIIPHTGANPAQDLRSQLTGSRMQGTAHCRAAAVASRPEICYTPSTCGHCLFAGQRLFSVCRGVLHTQYMDSNEAGTYVVALYLSSDQTISVGRLGEIEFPVGWYLYVGSALGPGGLRARLMRHRRLCHGVGRGRRLKSGKRTHWHVDYLREYATWGGAWGCYSQHRLECVWATALYRLPDVEIVAPGFGASDCRCPAHLVRVPALPGDDWFAGTLGAKRMDMENEELAALLQTLTTGDEEAREAAAMAIGRFGSIAIDPLAALLATGDSDARWWAARALAEVGGIGAVDPLIGVLADSDPDMRACAALGLGRIGDGQAAPAVAACLADESAFVASIAADALSMIGKPAVEPLAEMLANKSPHARLLAVRVLGRVGAQGAIAPLFGALEDPSYLVRYYAQEALEALGVGMVYLKP